MESPFEPLAFLEFARRLAISEDSEAGLRTAVSRAYYAIFLTAREKTGVRDKHKSHEKVIKALKLASKKTGEKLDSLRRLRSVADYDLLPKKLKERDWKINWEWTNMIVDNILSRLQTLSRR